MKATSTYTLGSHSTTFPKFINERHYMIPFTKQKGLPKQLKHWQDTVDAMLADIDSVGIAYFMCDQAIVRPNNTHRRPGLHVDGYWNGSSHGGGPGTHWKKPTDKPEQLILLSSNTGNTNVYTGAFTISDEFNGGDYSHLNYGDFDKYTTKPNEVLIGDTQFLLHDSGLFSDSTMRQLVRININME